MAMTTTTRRNILLAAISGLAVASLAAGLWLSLWPLDLGPGGRVAVRDASPADAAMDKFGKADDYAIIYSRDLRKPIVDSPTPKAAPVPLKTTLLCTMIEPDRKRAILQVAGGNIVEVEVGQMVEGDKVTAIQDGRVELMHNGSPAVLSIQEQKPN